MASILWAKFVAETTTNGGEHREFQAAMSKRMMNDAARAARAPKHDHAARVFVHPAD
jgi:hypothetical protein